MGNLQSMSYPNRVVYTYSYGTENRLTSLGVKNAATVLGTTDTRPCQRIQEFPGSKIGLASVDLAKVTSMKPRCAGLCPD